MRKSIPSFVGGELSFLKLRSVLVFLIGGMSIFFESQHSQIAVCQIAVFEIWVLVCRLELKLSQGNSIHKFFHLFCVCVNDVVRLRIGEGTCANS